jgi:hypothetical protein
MIQNNITAIIVVLSAVLAVTFMLVAYLLWRIRRIEGECELLLRDTRGHNFVEIVNDNIAQVDRLIGEVDGLSEMYALVLRRMAGSVQHVGVVRFDAFRDLGGLLSFSVALLDDRGNGLVFSSIYGRSESRTYAKPIVERGSKYDLSPEEKEAIRLALQSKEKGALPVEARDAGHEERMMNLQLFHDKELLERDSGLKGGVEVEERRPGRKAAPRERPAEKTEAGREPGRRRAAGTGGGETRANGVTATPRRESPGRVTHVGGSERRDREPRAKQRESAGRNPGVEKRVTERGKDALKEPVRKQARAKSKRPGPETPRAKGQNTPVERPGNRKPGDR